MFESLFKNINVFDAIVTLIFIYFIIQCFLKGFSLSLISFMKWVFSTIITIIFVPKLQPFVSDYISLSFINSVGLGIIILFFLFFL